MGLSSPMLSDVSNSLRSKLGVSYAGKGQGYSLSKLYPHTKPITFLRHQNLNVL